MTRADFSAILAKHSPFHPLDAPNYRDWLLDAMQDVWDSAIDAAAKECEEAYPVLSALRIVGVGFSGKVLALKGAKP